MTRMEELLVHGHVWNALLSSRTTFADVPEARRRTMAAIRGKHTRPEIMVRRVAHALGYRFRLHRRDLPGRPDLVFPGRRKVVMVHGCFWHQHQATACRAATMPKTRQEYWHPKLAANVARDARSLDGLTALGWDSLVIWECELRDTLAVANRLAAFLGPPGSARNGGSQALERLIEQTQHGGARRARSPSPRQPSC